VGLNLITSAGEVNVLHERGALGNFFEKASRARHGDAFRSFQASTRRGKLPPARESVRNGRAPFTVLSTLKVTCDAFRDLPAVSAEIRADPLCRVRARHHLDPDRVRTRRRSNMDYDS
jgi:hypothetical protein